MGYVNPDRDAEPRGFADQFEWDGHSWLLRRFHRARPVRVSAEEMDECIGYYEHWSGRLTKVLVALAVSSVVAVIYLDANDLISSDLPLEGVAGVTFAALGWMANRLVWFKATKRFSRRVPVGLGQSWLEERRSQAIGTGWLGLVGTALYLGACALMIWWLDPTRWLEMGMAALVGLAALLDLALKLRARIS